MSKYIYTVVFTFVLTFGCVWQNEGVDISIKVNKGGNSEFPIVEIVFVESGENIALRKYQGGKKLKNIGEIPNTINNSYEFQQIRDKNTNKIIGFTYSKDSKIVAERINNNHTKIEKGNIPNGIIIERYKNGKLNSIFQNENGKRNGYAISLYPNESIKTVVQYRNDYPVGIGRMFHENGNLKAEWQIENKIEKYHKEFDENGKLLFEEQN